MEPNEEYFEKAKMIKRLVQKKQELRKRLTEHGNIWKRIPALLKGNYEVKAIILQIKQIERLIEIAKKNLETVSKERKISDKKQSYSKNKKGVRISTLKLGSGYTQEYVYDGEEFERKNISFEDGEYTCSYVIETKNGERLREKIVLISQNGERVTIDEFQVGRGAMTRTMDIKNSTTGNIMVGYATQYIYGTNNDYEDIGNGRLESFTIRNGVDKYHYQKSQDENGNILHENVTVDKAGKMILRYDYENERK